MKKTLLLILSSFILLESTAQYWQQQADYVIDVSLDSREKSLDAFARITYTNNSPDTLRFIWFHLWPNAYKHDRTAFSDQLLENGNTAFYFSDREKRGYINRLDFKVDGTTARTEDHPQHVDIVRLILPAPLPPGQQILITTPFHVKLPFNFSRGGYDGQSFQATQWFPKPAVYDQRGWHPMPYLDQGEFYSEFGSYDVRISVPDSLVVAATGELHKTDSSGGSRTYYFRQDSVHDFAWFADKDFLTGEDTVVLASGRTVKVFSYYTPAHSKLWKEAAGYAKEAIRFYSREVGDYPYNTVTVVQGPPSFGGGMEYPTITIISPTASAQSLDQVIAHEVGHNWFQGMLASNERDYPWLDEGLNSFYEEKYIESRYGPQPKGAELFFQTKAQRKTDQPIAAHSKDFSPVNYGLSVYHKTAEWMRLLEKKYGEDKFRQAMQSYFQAWKFRHPYPEDFRQAILSRLDGQAAEYFELLYIKGVLPDHELEGFRFLSPFKKNSIGNYLMRPSRNILFVSPIFGANYYDKVMVGAVLTNYKLPPNKFHYLLAPLYGIGSKRLGGLGRLSYTYSSEGRVRKADIFLNGSTFSMDGFKSPEGDQYLMSFAKLAPGFRLTFRNRDPRSHVRNYIQWKTFLIREESLRARRDTLINGMDTSVFFRYLFPKQDRYLNQLRFVHSNSRALYPYSIALQLEQSTDFIRPTLTANYYFNYRDGGLQVRLFAGKFIYLKGRTVTRQFANDRYLLNMTGPKGYEDYSYSDYFLGRTEFEGLSSQQIMIRDGAFKVRTDMLASKIGKTDNWLTAVNFNATIPDKINPLSVLPIKIPLRIFLDIGTYAEAWEKNAEGDRFLYDLGIHIPLFREVVNFYFPILYNKEYADYFKSTIPKNRFFKTMSFSINLYNKDVKEINRELEF